MEGDTRKFEDITYLGLGNEKQKSAFNTLNTHDVLGKLAAFDPLLVGTVPIGIDIDGSDLDIICNMSDAPDFQQVLINHFSSFKLFHTYQTVIRGSDVIVAGFYLDSWEIEVFGQNKPTKQQNGYRHMIVEYKLLQKYGETLKEKVIALKKTGIKTEPAFAMALQLTGDPYLELLDYF